MKLRREDNVVVIAGRDKGKAGKVVRTIPGENKVIVENVNVAKRHTKPSQKNPRGGILEIVKPIDVSKLMVLDPASGKPARIGYEIKPDGTKERIFKVSAHKQNEAKPAKKAATKKAESAPTDDKAGNK